MAEKSVQQNLVQAIQDAITDSGSKTQD